MGGRVGGGVISSESRFFFYGQNFAKCKNQKENEMEKTRFRDRRVRITKSETFLNLFNFRGQLATKKKKNKKTRSCFFGLEN